MLDTPSIRTTKVHWHDTIASGDVVLFRFPIRNLKGESGDCKIRPCLVLERFEFDAGTFVELCFGTTVPTRKASGLDVAIWQPELAQNSGLHHPTRFEGARRVIVPVTHRNFEQRHASNSPVIGSLDPALSDRLDLVRDRIARARKARTLKPSHSSRRTHLRKAAR